MSKELLLYFAEHTSLIFKGEENFAEALLQVKEYLTNEGAEATILISENDKTLSTGRAFINERGKYIIEIS